MSVIHWKSVKSNTDNKSLQKNTSLAFLKSKLKVFSSDMDPADVGGGKVRRLQRESGTSLQPLKKPKNYKVPPYPTAR